MHLAGVICTTKNTEICWIYFVCLIKVVHCWWKCSCHKASFH